MPSGFVHMTIGATRPGMKAAGLELLYDGQGRGSEPFVIATVANNNGCVEKLTLQGEKSL